MTFQFASFRLGVSLFSLDALLIREINRNLDITPVDKAPVEVVGLMNLRGQIVTVLDLGVLLGLGKRTFSAQTCCVVLKTDREAAAAGIFRPGLPKDTIGLLVDEIGDMRAAEDSDLEAVPANASGRESGLIRRVIRSEGGLIADLDISRMNVSDAARS